MATRHKTSFATSITLKKSLDNADGLYQAQTVINEHVRKSVGGSGEITGPEDNVTVSGGWADGDNTPVTSNASTIAVTTSTDMLWIKHTGLLFGTTNACADADTVNIKIDASATSDVTGADTVVLANLAKGEGMLFPRPGSSWGLILASVSAHVGVEILEIGT
jgi:hypothetical protein